MPPHPADGGRLVRLQDAEQVWAQVEVVAQQAGGDGGAVDGACRCVRVWACVGEVEQQGGAGRGVRGNGAVGEGLSAGAGQPKETGGSR